MSPRVKRDLPVHFIRAVAGRLLFVQDAFGLYRTSDGFVVTEQYPNEVKVVY